MHPGPNYSVSNQEARKQERVLAFRWMSQTELSWIQVVASTILGVVLGKLWDALPLRRSVTAKAAALHKQLTYIEKFHNDPSRLAREAIQMLSFTLIAGTTVFITFTSTMPYHEYLSGLVTIVEFGFFLSFITTLGRIGTFRSYQKHTMAKIELLRASEIVA